MMRKRRKMFLSVLLSHLGQYHTVRFGNQSTDPDLQGVRLFAEGQTFFDESYLYLSNTGRLPKPEIRDPFVLFCFGAEPDYKVYNDSAFVLVYFGDKISFQKLFNDVQNQLTEVQQITAGMHILVNALFAEKGLQYIVNTASRVFGNPVYIIDPQGKYLAFSEMADAGSDFARAENSSGYISEEGMEIIRKYKIDEKVRESRDAYYFSNPLHHMGMLIDVIRIQGIETGHVMIEETVHPFSEFDGVLLHRFSQLISIELQKDTTFTANKGVMYSYLLADLLTHPEVNAPQVAGRLRSFGYDLKENLYIFSISSNSFSSSSMKLDVIISQIRNLLTGSIYVVYENSLVFLVGRAKYDEFSEYELSRLTNFLITNNLKAGISNFFNSLLDTRRFYLQSLDAVNIGTKLGDPGPIYNYKDYYVYSMLQACEKQDSQIRFFVNPGLMHLRDYDKEHATELVKTLKEYLNRPNQPSLISQTLHIHRNTLLYRMEKIKEITSCSLENGNDLLSLALSYRIMEYLGWI